MVIRRIWSIVNFIFCYILHIWIRYRWLLRKFLWEGSKEELALLLTLCDDDWIPSIINELDRSELLEVKDDKDVDEDRDNEVSFIFKDEKLA